jgi:uncharacterized protein
LTSGRSPAARRARRDGSRVLYPFAPRTAVLLVPGLQDSGPEHWQTLWQAQHPSFLRVAHDDFGRPALERWSAAVARAIDACEVPPIVVAHSFGCLAALHAVAHWRRTLAGALLVAPADPDKFELAAKLPPRRLAFPSTLVASTNDPWIKLVKAGALAAGWGSRFVSAGAAGHLDAESGLGAWPAGIALLRDVAERAAAAGTVRAMAAPDLRDRV